MDVSRSLAVLTLVGLGALVLPACSSSGGGSSGTGASTLTTESVCDTDPRAMAYSVGLAETATGGLKMSFVDASPAPPTKGLNAWTMKIEDATGAPMSGATVALKPYMPDHGHGASVIPQVMPMTDAGTYQITDIDFFMPGIWQNTFTVTPASGAPQTVVFTFCIDG
jgi:hypothetical protein